MSSSAVQGVLRRLEHFIPTSAILKALVPQTLKGLFWVLILVNIRAFPLSWHFRVFRPVFALRLRYLWMRVKLRLSLKPSKVRKLEMDNWYGSLAPVGADPFDMTITYNAWAGPEDCDFNLHLSNSCYPKILDSARFKAALAMFPSLFPCGGWIALAGTHHSFIREIPMFAKYELRMNVGSWDNKWVYIVVRFVTHPKNKGKGRKSQGQTPPAETNGSVPTSLPSVPPFHTPATPISIPATPANPVVPDANRADSSSTVNETVRQLAKAQMATEEPDGATLHCVAVSQIVFKHGRITIPPAIVLAMNGFCGPISEGGAPSYADVAKEDASKPAQPQRYSPANPPPYWAQVSELTKLSNQKALREFLRGGWKTVPEGERWWETALDGEIEKRRRERFDVLNSVRIGIDGARHLR
ncbi:hypothetical protein GLOTRDRAFT_58778 [Gloeophyllum trabeum ATCC 11539]|uniref:Thioesterase/thiol ester dehydrase-isomerase n=1 Tax=Gloeophyllum trabeum (strain ATCC 11539 / FP-39264 / Madison 617) TaxID=670483 RepID=S7QDG2_GLOTA|nr:uncharacterized protein GLOTRDRAFT_58778 [Gloeophyllum trabeum ATCC 11539]EPQ57428.1 hypothetical protein GLOTRDRAFT_58778 [Gloeophyllum trabeum ATCC 11539]